MKKLIFLVLGFILFVIAAIYQSGMVEMMEQTTGATWTHATNVWVVRCLLTASTASIILYAVFNRSEQTP